MISPDWLDLITELNLQLKIYLDIYSLRNESPKITKTIKTYESFGKNINQFIELVRKEINSRVGNLYDLCQELQDDGYSISVIVGLKGPQYEEDFNLDIVNDIVDLFDIDRNLNISDSIVDDLPKSIYYIDWILHSSFDLLLDDLVFIIFFGLPIENNYSKLERNSKKCENDFDNFLLN